MVDDIENSIIQSLLNNIEYFNKVFTHLKETHFTQIENIEIFKQIKDYYKEYQEHPKPKEIGLKLKNIKSQNLRDSTLIHFKELMTSDKIQNLQFIVDESEKYVQKMEFTKAILEGADAIQKDGDLNPIYGLIGEALRINFDSDLGLVFTTDVSRRLNYYKRKIQGMSTGVKDFDDLLGGGFRNKTLNIIASVSHGGKSAFLAHFAAFRTLQGDDGIYYTLEMPEEETCKRIDGNVLDIDINLFSTTPDEVFEEKLNIVKNNLGILVVKEYPAGVLDVLKIESHINEYFMEYNKMPKYICVDYLTLMKSSRASLSNTNTYSYYKLVSEELHALAKKYNIPVISCSQINRSGYNNKEAGLENVSDSIGIAQTADTFIILIRTKELDAEGHCVLNFVKNRNTGILSQCLSGIDFNKMRFYSLNNINNNITPANNPSKFDNFDYGSMFE